MKKEKDVIFPRKNKQTCNKIFIYRNNGTIKTSFFLTRNIGIYHLFLITIYNIRKIIFELMIFSENYNIFGNIFLIF